MDFVSRLKSYIEHKRLQNSQVADMAGIPRPTLSQLLTGRNKKVSNELIEKLHQAFPALNVLWLLFGDGPMEIDSDIEFSEPQKDLENSIFSTQLSDNSDSYDSFGNTRDITGINEQKSESMSVSAIMPVDGCQTPAGRRVQSIMIFYSDNSFEVFEPARKTLEDS